MSSYQERITDWFLMTKQKCDPLRGFRLAGPLCTREKKELKIASRCTFDKDLC